jgi:hypothetical protein
LAQLLGWWRQATSSDLTLTRAASDLVAARVYRAPENKVRKQQRMLVKKTMECDREAVGLFCYHRRHIRRGCAGSHDNTAEHRFGRVNRLPSAVAWMTNDGSCYTASEIFVTLAAAHIMIEARRRHDNIVPPESS